MIRGSRIVATTAHPSGKFVSALDANNHKVTRVGRRGKYLLIGLEGKKNTAAELVIHLGMTGSIRVDGSPPQDSYCRAHWHLDNCRHLWLRDVRRFGRIAVVPQGDHLSIPTLYAMGPEPFDPNLDAHDFHRSLSSSRRRIKTYLLSQRPIAGIGNIYADEALWRSKINPSTRRVGVDRAAHLLAAIRAVLTEALQHGGTTLRDYRMPNGNKGSNQYRLDCYGRAGKPCSRCNARLTHRIVDQRSTTWCPTCQAH